MTNTVICVDLRHLRNSRSDIADTTQKKGEHKVRPYYLPLSFRASAKNLFSVTFGLTQK